MNAMSSADWAKWMLGVRDHRMSYMRASPGSYKRGAISIPIFCLGQGSFLEV